MMRITVAVAVACFSLVAITSGNDAEAAMRKQTNIAAQGLAPALELLAKQRDVQVVYRSELVGDHQTSGAAGDLTFDEALTQLLSGTGLTYRYLDDKAITIIPVGSSTGSATASSLTSEQPGTIDSASAHARAGGEGGGDSSHDASKKSLWDRFRLAQVDQGAPASSPTVEKKKQQASDQNPVKLEEVIVTARKVEERLIDVPESVTVLNPDTLSAQGVLQLRDYADRIPGVSVTTSGAGYSTIVVRGLTIGSGNDLISGTAIYVDEVPFGSSSNNGNSAYTTPDASLFDMERIEVLKGPQGTLYGADAMGGLIKYVTKPPSTVGFGGQAQAGFASTWYGGVSYNVAASANVPLVDDKLALRASSWYSRDGGYIDNLALGQKDVNRSGIYGGRLDLLFTPAQKLSVRLGAFLQNISRDGTGLADYDLSGRPVDGSLDQRRLTPEPYYQRFRLVSGTVTYDLDWARLISISSYQTLPQMYGTDLTDLIPGYKPFYDYYGFTNGLSKIAGPTYIRTNKFTQEVRLSSERRGPFDWVIGGFYTNEGDHYDTYNYFFDLDGQPTGNANANLAYTSLTSFREYAPFGTLTWHLTEKFVVSGGLRYSHSALAVSQRNYTTQPYETDRSSESVFTYLADTRYRFSDHATFYLHYATGYRPGGPNSDRFDIATGVFVPQPPFKSDTLKSYELGFKGETEDRRYGIEAAAFYLDWSNIQLSVCGADFCGFDNLPGGARIPGAELALTARPISALTLASALTYLDGRVRQADANLGAAKNERLPGAARYTASLGADYVFAQDGLRPTLGASLRYVSDRRAGFDGSVGNPQYRLPDYTVVDLHAGFRLGRVDGQLYVRNLFDERGQLSTYTYAAAAPNNGPAQIAIIQPRTIGLTASTHF